jgi:hypothetical protein
MGYSQHVHDLLEMPSRARDHTWSTHTQNSDSSTPRAFPPGQLLILIALVMLLLARVLRRSMLSIWI